MAVWFGLNLVSTDQGWFVGSEIQAGDNQGFMEAMKKDLKQESKGNVVMLLIDGGEKYDSYSSSKGQPVNPDTVFGVASLGKWVAATGVMTLVESGKLDLDEPVSTYLTRWQLPKGSFSNSGVTTRRLLSHTAGIIDGLGHNGFETKAQVQPLVEHLTKAKDAEEDVDGRVIVGLAPGSTFKYSGGSYNLLQLLIEEVSGMSFEQYMQKAVFDPLQMNNTTYAHEEIENLAQYFDSDGNQVNYPFYTSLAATGLYTTANDIYKYLTVFMPNKNSGILAPQTLLEMRKPHASTMGIDIWGLGVMLFASNNNNDFIIGHGGQSPHLNATARINPETGNAIIVFETGNRALASDTATKWTTWQTGNPDIYMLKNMIPDMLKRVVVGCIIILVISLIAVWRNRTKKK